MDPVERKRVVVIGAGFAGINAVHELRDLNVDVTIVDRNNFHTFQPLLYQVATGYLSAEEVGATTRSIFRSQRNVHAVVGDVVGVDWESQHITLSDGHALSFDYLIIAAGGTANLGLIPGMTEHSYPLYTLDDAVRLRKHLLTEMEKSVLNVESPSKTTVVVVGGGPTGVETAGALSTMEHDLLGSNVEDLRVVLIEALPRLLNGFHEKSGQAAWDGLHKLGVEILLNTKVKEADATSITLDDGTVIETQTIIWAAGILAVDLGERFGLDVNKKRGITVEPTLQVVGKPNVFVAGDISWIKDTPAPQLAPAAIQTGKHAARQIKHLIKGEPVTEFRYLNKGNMAVIGRGAAVVELPHNISFRGRLAWFAWLGLHIVYLVGFRNRLKVLIDWGWNYFTNRGASAILIKDQ